MFPPIDWSTGEPAHTLSLREKLMQVRDEIRKTQCATYRDHKPQDCPRCKALEIIEQELAQ